MFRYLLFSLPISLFLMGCAAHTPQTSLSADHPANPLAAPGPVASPPLTLRQEPQDMPRTSSPVPAMDESVHSGHAMSQPDHGTERSMDAVYSCPMHPEVLQNKPGKCPKCGMRLVKKEKPR